MQDTDQSSRGATQDTPASIAAPSISLPKGGGAIRGIGEKFGTNAATGTGSLNIPIALSQTRQDFGPQLSLNYDTGSGNGSFGLGWNLSLASITRKTDQGLPLYNDAEDSDVFILSDSEDLVPVLVEENGAWTRQPIARTVEGIDYRIERYRPRIEGLFARIERWTSLQTGAIHWRAINRENITTLYGNTNNSRIFDPENPQRIFRWLISQSYDDKGNVIVYEYKEENGEAVPLSDVHERNRTSTIRSAERHIKRIRYGNRVSRLIDAEAALNDWMFEVVFDYGEHDPENPLPDDDGTWLCRHDPFSTYRSGFEVRSYRLCQRVLLFHHFPDDEAVGQNCLVRSLDFSYRNIRNNPDDVRQGHPIASFLASVTQRGCRRQQNGFLRRSMPPVEFEYSSSTIHEELQELELESLDNVPYGIDGANYQWLDLDGEGTSGIVMQQGGGWFYKRNLSPISSRPGEAVLSPVELITVQPSLNAASGSSQQFLDLAGDGQVDLVQFGQPVSGYFERTETSRGWSNFVPFTSFPSISLDDPNVRFVDLTGDGHADILVSEDEVFVWYPSLGESGFAPGTRVAQALNEEEGPRLVLSDSTQSIYLADLSGDGLTDLVRVRNGEVCYWPNLGYGTFGAKVTMTNSPWFDESDQFDQKRVLLADIDGSGVTDVIYLGRNRVDLYFNECGNSWSERQSLTQVPANNNLTSIAAIDLLGNGTACLVWSSSLPGERVRSLSYVDLMGGQKPHLLVRTVNNLGMETRVHYASSTSFYLEDKFAGRPWLTKLPFPVHVVERVETLDHIGRNRFVTRYTYHHGYFDGGEREFRGFGMVEQFDTEELASLTSQGTLPNANNLDPASHVPPVLTRTWFHTGALIDAGRISRQFEDEYYREGDPSLGEKELSDEQVRSMLLDDTIVPNTVRLPDGERVSWSMSDEEALEASRSLKGAALRQEIYAVDGSEAMDRPYTVSERNYTIEMLQPRGDNENAVFFMHPRESIEFQYDRRLFDVNGRMLADPRVAHSVTLAADMFGNATESTTIGYGRRHSDPNPLLTAEDRQRQRETLITHTRSRFTNAVLEEDSYRVPVSAESQTYEIVNVAPAANEPDVTNLFRFAELLEATQLLSDIPSENVFAEGVNDPGRRLIEHTRALYRRNDFNDALPLGELESLAIPFESYTLALTPGLVSQVYGERVTDEILANEGGYVHVEGDPNWWSPDGHYLFSPGSTDTPAEELDHARAHFFVPKRFVDPFGNTTIVLYDSDDLLPVESRDPLGNTTIGQNDYRVMQPRAVTDPNGNRTTLQFDALGMVAGAALMGKQNEALGDSFNGFEPDLDEETILSYLQDPFTSAHELLGEATSRLVYDLHAYRRTSDSDNPQPNVICTLRRETHVSDLPPDQLTRIQHGFNYSDGFGQEIQKKLQAEPGPINDGAPDVDRRWVGTGWTIFNNKGKPVRKFEPFFSTTHQFEFAQIVGVSPIYCYDPIERVVAEIYPNHTWQKAVFDPWQQRNWDVNDTVAEVDPANDPDVGEFFRRLPPENYLPTWHAQRIDGQFGETQQQRAAAQDAAEKSTVHGQTPTSSWSDTLGRSFLTVAHNRFIRNDETIEEQLAARFHFDIEGNRRDVRDALERTVARYDFDLVGNQIHSSSMEAGERWLLPDVKGGVVRTWDGRGHAFRTEHDELRRPVRSFVTGTDPNDPENEILFERTIYGEGQGDANNHRGRVFQVFDGGGLVTNNAYDFKGNILQVSRQLLEDYRAPADWSVDLPLENEVFVNQTTYDALNRPVTLTTPDDSRVRPTYNEANLLERLEINLQGADAATVVVNDIDYSANGQRVLIELGNGVRTSYRYDPLTLQLTNLITRRGDERLQDLFYTYDPTGNITDIRDDSQQTVYFNNQVVEPHAQYTYDAIYRLIEAGGREHLGQVQQPQSTWNDEFRVNLSHPHDGQAMRRYNESYEYDQVGNILRLIHQATNGNWTRNYDYNEASLLQPALPNNRVSQTEIGGAVETYTHDSHGNITSMPHLPLMNWNHLSQLRASSQQVVNEGTPETTHYVYDSNGKRIRKVTDRQAAPNETPRRRNERIYLGSFEVYREYEADGTTISLARETLQVMDDEQRVALVETLTAGNDGSPPQLIRYQVNNHLGSSATELDHNGEIISYEEYYPYGSSSYKAGRTVVEVSQKRYRHSAKERDEETGLSYHGARYYASWLGRWTAADPGGIGDSINLFVYVGNNPINLHDLDGKKRKQPMYGGIRVAKKSEITAQEMVDMIKRSDKLEPWMKNMFVADEDEIRLISPRLPRVPKDSKYKKIPEWFQNVLVAVNSRNWFFSTGATVISERALLGIIPDINKESGIDHTFRGNLLSFGVSQPRPSLTKAEIRRAGRQKKDPETRHPLEHLVIVTNRYRFSDKSRKELDIARDEAAIVETFFHELGAHGGLINQGKPPEVSGHTSPGYEQRLEPMSEADWRAYDVAEVLEKKWDETNIEKAKSLGVLETPVGVILELDTERDVAEQRKQDVGRALEIVEELKQAQAAKAAGAGP